MTKQPEPVRCVCRVESEIRRSSSNEWAVACGACRWSGSWHLTRRAAILAWNAVMQRSDHAR